MKRHAIEAVLEAPVMERVIKETAHNLTIGQELARGSEAEIEVELASFAVKVMQVPGVADSLNSAVPKIQALIDWHGEIINKFFVAERMFPYILTHMYLWDVVAHVVLLSRKFSDRVDLVQFQYDGEPLSLLVEELGLLIGRGELLRLYSQKIDALIDPISEKAKLEPCRGNAKMLVAVAIDIVQYLAREVIGSNDLVTLVLSFASVWMREPPSALLEQEVSSALMAERHRSLRQTGELNHTTSVVGIIDSLSCVHRFDGSHAKDVAAGLSMLCGNTASLFMVNRKAVKLQCEAQAKINAIVRQRLRLGVQ